MPYFDQFKLSAHGDRTNAILHKMRRKMSCYVQYLSSDDNSRAQRKVSASPRCVDCKLLKRQSVDKEEMKFNAFAVSHKANDLFDQFK